MPPEHFDVLIIGAGLSGIAAGYHLQTKCPSKTYVILEGRDAIGGTWDLFRYPGIRSDSDMYTLGYSFKPWTEPKAIAAGPRILNYVHVLLWRIGHFIGRPKLIVVRINYRLLVNDVELAA